MVPKMPLRVGLVEQGRQLRHRLQQLDAVFFLENALIHFEEGHTALQSPEIICGRLSSDIPVHGTLEQDRAHNSVTVKAGAGDDARAHLVHERKHLFVVGPRAFLDAVITQRLGACCHRSGPAQQRSPAGF